MVEDLKRYKVLNETCYRAMEAASKATATEKGLKGDCLREFISKNRLLLDIPPIITQHIMLQSARKPRTELSP